MGAKDSKRACLSYEDAVKRLSDTEFKRICEAFKRVSGGGQLMSPSAFTQHVLGEGVPVTVAGWLYTACGGTTRGIAQRDLICGLVLLTRGAHEERLRFLWTLYCNESGTHISRSDFQRAIRLEGAPPPNTGPPLFASSQDRVTYDDFKNWIVRDDGETVLSRWLLTEDACVSLSSDQDTLTFYQTLAGVTHLEEKDICDLEKSFWLIQASTSTGQLDLQCLSALISPPVPNSACAGLFQALDVNRDGHIDFKELCCGVSAACRGPIAERVKFCFKIFDEDSDGKLNQTELKHMFEILRFISGDVKMEDEIEGFTESFVSQEEFVIWALQSDGILVRPLLELLFQVCHVSLGLRPRCKHHERDIVTGWLTREEKRGYRVGQFWYLISSEWWLSWLNYTSHPGVEKQCECENNRTSISNVQQQLMQQRSSPSTVEEGIACDESFTSNSSESMGDLLRGVDSCSVASSSGVSSGSGGGQSTRKTNILQHPSLPGSIDNSSLISDEQQYRTSTLTGEGGRLRRDRTLVQHRDFELVPDSLWKALASWYGGPLPLPRQVIRIPGTNEVDLELYPLNLRILRHQQQNQVVGHQNAWAGGVVGGYGAAALSGAGLGSTQAAVAAASLNPRRYLAHTAAFSRLATIGQVLEFLSQRLGLCADELRLWCVRDEGHQQLTLLEDERATLQEIGARDGDQVLLEVRNADQTWPEELGALAAGTQQQERGSRSGSMPSPLPAGATGLHNLGNTCFMNAALQAVSNTRPLTLYFRRDARLCELNADNPLGTRGQVARRYAELCRELWAGGVRSVAPLKMRWCVARHAPHLGGGGQHDSQELLAWLLDTLHEDLNRVTGKQYTELSDSAGRPDAIVAGEAWKHHLARDHSVITDLFYGQLKSKVTCQTCGHESVRFDAFNVLSLPLPMDSFTLCEVLIVRLDGSLPIKYGVRLPSDSSYTELKQRLHRICGVPPTRLLLAEVSDSHIRQVLTDNRRIDGATSLDLYGYEIPGGKEERLLDEGTLDEVPEGDEDEEEPERYDAIIGMPIRRPSSPRQLARSPEVSNASALCMPSILCFKGLAGGASRRSDSLPLQNGVCRSHRGSIIVQEALNATPAGYVTAVHRKQVRQDAYFIAQHRTRPALFGVPLLLGCGPATTCQDLYEAVWTQVTRLLSPLPRADQTNHATDCDDSLGYEFPFTLRAVSTGGRICAMCPWTKFCRGCALPCEPRPVMDVCCGRRPPCLAIDWDPTALHLRYQACRERQCQEHGSVAVCRRQHTEPIDLDQCLRAFTTEERLETRYHCSTCEDKQPATKKLQIWRLPPILIIHLKRFDYVNNKWVKTHKAVNFPFRDFDPTAYLASVPQETILTHRRLRGLAIATHNHLPAIDDEHESRIVDCDGDSEVVRGRRDRLESTSLLRTPVLDEHLEDFHGHHLLEGQDPFELKYQLYAVVSHSGMLNGGHYVSYARNPNGTWYCYNDSSCREVTSSADITSPNITIIPDIDRTPKIDTSSAYILFYERAGLNYAPYLPDVPVDQTAPNVDSLDDGESELRRQMCALS